MTATRTLRLPTATAAAALLLIAAAAGLRAAAALDVLWLDEIWTLDLLQRVNSPLEIITGIHHDNNHYLNTLLLYVTGPGQPWVVYRAPAIAAGVLSVAAAGWIAGSRGRLAQLTVMSLLGSSYLMIHYSSEARGYALAVLFALTAYESLRRYLDNGRTRWAAMFGASVILGLLSHLMFVHVYGAAVCWSLANVASRSAGHRGLVESLARLHAAPLAFLALLYWLDIRHLEFGGGPAYAVGPLVLEAASLAVGGPLGGWLAGGAAALLVLGIAAGAALLMRDGRDEVKFLLLVILLPIIQIVVARPQFMFVRYFLFAIVFALLLCGYALAELFRQGRLGKLAYAGLLLLFVSGNALHYRSLIEHGRGQYLAALKFMSETSGGGRLTISGDHNHGIRKLVEFYAAYLPGREAVVYYDANDWPPEGPGWLILHQYGRLAGDPFEDVYELEGHLYRRARVFETAILSGWRWHCYRRAEEYYRPEGERG